MLRGQSRQERCTQTRLARRDYFNGVKDSGIPGKPNNEDSTDTANMNCTTFTSLRAIDRLTFISVKTTPKKIYSVSKKHSRAWVTGSYFFFLGLFRHSESN